MDDGGNRKLKFEIDKEKDLNGLTKKDNLYFKERNQEFITQINKLKTNNKKWTKNY